MKLWLLQPHGGDLNALGEKVEAAGGSFSGYVDSHGFVIAAETAEDARQMGAAADCNNSWWADPAMTECTEIGVAHGRPARILLAAEPTG